MSTISPAPNFKLIGHRGVAGLRPENTLCSFAYAAELGLNWIEFDVQLSKDNKWVVMHDDTLERTTNGKGKISNYTQADLALLQAGLWFHPPYPKQPIPTLETTLKLTTDLNLNCNIEIKGSSQDPEKYAHLMADFLQHHPVAQTLLVSSFELPCLQILRKIDRTAKISYLVDKFSADTIELALEHKFASINCDVQHITTHNLSAATAKHIPVMLYTINDPVLAHYWLNEGVAAVFTDRPDLLQAG